MATDPAVPPRDRTHRLWQVPTFLVGLAALYILWHSGDKLRPSVADRYERSLHALRPAVDRWPPDIDRIQAALRKVPTEAPPAELAPQAHYLIGSAFVALAESTTSEAEAAEWWARARQDLEAAADRDLPAQDQKKLRYRLARAWANTGADLNRTIEFLTNYLAAGDDPAEGHRLLADLYLKVTPPNEPKARDSLQNFLRHAPARADARSLNQARVRLAELHAKLNEPEEARKVLDRVGPEAPPELFAAARLMLADHHRADQDWSGATKAWEQVRDMRGATEAQRSEALVRLGEAYAKLNRPGDAAAAVDQAGKAGGPGGRAGAFRTAELKLKDPAGLTAAVAALESAFAGADPAALRRLVPPADAKRVCNEAFEKAKEAGDSSLVLRVANVYAKVSENADHHRLLAEAHEARAKAANPDDAKGHFRSAAEACTAAAAQEATPTGKADWLRKAAGLFVKSGDRAKAMAMLGDLTPRLAEYPEDRVGRAWVEAGEVYLAAGDKEQARLAFRTAAGRPGPDRDRARVRFAALSAEAEPAQGSAAVAMLEDVINTPPGDTRDRATHEEAAYLLGELHLVAKQLPEAEVRLRMALDVYPESPRAARGRYQLGQAFRQKAAAEARKIEADRAALAKIKQERVELRQAAYKIDEQSKIEDRIDRSWKAYEEAMRAAYETFRKAEEQLLTVKDADPEVVRRTSFWAADCAHWLGEYADCSARYEKLIGRYKDTVWELDATRNLHRCCRFAAEAAREAKDTDGAARWAKRVGETFAKMKEALARVPATELDGSTELKTKAFWDKWVAENGPRAGIAE